MGWQETSGGTNVSVSSDGDMPSKIKNEVWRLWAKTHWYGRQMVQQFFAHDCMASAGTLTYTTLFAIVPFTAVAYKMFSLFADFEQIRDLIQGYVFANFLPSMGTVVQEKIVEFSEQASNLAWISLAFLFVTAFLMLVTIEKSFNKVWHVVESRSGLQRLMVYWSVLSLGPLLVCVGLLISLYFVSLEVLSELNVFGVGDLLLSHLPKFLNIAAFTVLYYTVPNCEVPFRHALAGGVLAMLAFGGVQWAFTGLVPYLSFNAVYGAFAAVPIFLFWIYLGWVVVLSGLIFVRSLSLKRDAAPTPEPLLLKAARVLQILSDAHNEGRSVADSEISQQVKLNSSEAERVFSELRKMRLLQIGENERWVLGRSLRTLTLWDLYQALPEGIDEEQLRGVDDLPGVVEPIRAITRFGSNEMTVSLEAALGASNPAIK